MTADDRPADPTASAKPTVWESVSSAFLRRRVHRQRMRAAALRALKLVEAGAGDRFQLDFDAASDVLQRVGPWMGAYVAELPTFGGARSPLPSVPPMSIIMMVVGSRGDVQPFVPIGQAIAGAGHRVRLATHEEFRSLVEKAGLEFYPLAGDPRELMDYMVRTGGSVVPTHLDQIVEDVPRKRALIGEILESTWRACTEPDPGRPNAPSFTADGIIANPPSYGHFHCAEALSIPLHMIFTMPWTATAAYPHPLARLDQSGDRPMLNWLSYGVVDMLMWVGVADVVNAFRAKTLGLPPMDVDDGTGLLDDNEVPFTYLFPESLVPRPVDWDPHIDVASFVFWDQAEGYEPPPALRDFLAAGDPPIYVGFGSCVVEDAEGLTRTLFEAFDKAKVRGVVSEGWAKLGGATPPPDVHLVGDTPHDWLFPRCRAVCHHGGAGTTAAGLRAGLPSVVVPFFGDQFFWGRMLADAGASPEPIPIAELTSERLAGAFAACVRSEMQDRSAALGARVCAEDGVDLVLASLYRHLPLSAMVCAQDPGHLAVVYCDDCRKRLCRPCYEGAHAGHVAHPYRYIEWSARSPNKVTDDVRALVTDAAAALREGLGKILPIMAPRRHGVVFGENEAPGDEAADEPVRRRDRRHGRAST
jgi:UDP:flavonoid glycosyltransferase YjiC (YdhE family)